MRTNPFFDLYKCKYRKEFPWVLDVEATNACNLKCQMCSRQIMDRPIGFLEEKTFKKIIKDIGSYYCGIRFIRWGEPFLNHNLIKYVGIAKKNELPVHITNNGQIVTEEELKVLVLQKLDSIIFSMQGATKEGYEKMRVGANYDRLVYIINKLVEYRGDLPKPFIQITSTMTDETEEQIGEFKNRWEKVVDYVSVGKTHFSRLGKEKPVYRQCMEVVKKLSVDWDGEVTACCGDFNKLLVVGNLKKETLSDIWQSRKMNALRTMLEEGMHRSLSLCSTCNHAYDNI